MVLLSLHGLAAAQIAALLDCYLAMVGRFDREGWPGWPTGPGCGWLRLGGLRTELFGMPLGMRRRFGSKVCYRTQIWSSSGP
jgi:hypothetical protein